MFNKVAFLENKKLELRHHLCIWLMKKHFITKYLAVGGGRAKHKKTKQGCMDYSLVAVVTQATFSAV